MLCHVVYAALGFNRLHRPFETQGFQLYRFVYGSADPQPLQIASPSVFVPHESNEVCSVG